MSAAASREPFQNIQRCLVKSRNGAGAALDVAAGSRRPQIACFIIRSLNLSPPALRPTFPASLPRSPRTVTIYGTLIIKLLAYLHLNTQAYVLTMANPEGSTHAQEMEVGRRGKGGRRRDPFCASRHLVRDRGLQRPAMTRAW